MGGGGGGGGFTQRGWGFLFRPFPGLRQSYDDDGAL